MKTTRHGCLRALLLLCALAALVAAGGFYYRHQLIARAQDRINRDLESDGLFVAYTLDPDVRLHAITLRDVTFFEASDRTAPAATLDHLSLRFSLLGSLFAGAPEVIASTRQAKLVVFGGKEPVAWENLSFTFRHRASSRSLEHLQATVRGLVLQLTAHWEIPDRAQPAPSPSPAQPAAPATPSPAQSAAPAALPSPEPSAAQPSRLDLSGLVALAESLDYRQAGFQPHLSLKADGKLAPDGSVTWTLTGDSRSFPSRGADLHLDATGSASRDGTAVLHGLTLTQAERKAHVQGTYRKAEKVFEIGKLDSNLDWTGLLRDFPALQEALSGVQTVSPPQFSLRGKYHLGHGEKSDLAFSVSDWALNYQSSSDRAPLPIQALQLQGTLQAGALEIPSFQATVADGDVTGEASLTPFAEKPGWRSSFDARNLSLARMVKPSERFPAEGLLQLSFAGFGSFGTKTMQGQGHLEITNGKLFDVALLGSLLRFVERISPGLGAGVSDQVKGNFVIRDGLLRTDDLLLEVSASKIAVQGQVDLESRQTSLEARAHLRGLLSAITESLTEGQGLVIEGSGPVDRIDWRLKRGGKGAPPTPSPQPEPAPAGPEAAPAGSLKEQIKQQAMDSLLNGTAEEAVGNLLQGIRERRALRRQERDAVTEPPPN